MLRIAPCLLLMALVASGTVLAQRAAPEGTKPTGHLLPLPSAGAVPAIITDLSRLPAPVARTRERILAAARSGDLQQLAALVKEAMPIFSFTEEKDPVAFWKANYPDSDGVEVLSILTMILELGFVHLDEGTQQEMYVWPYFVRMPLAALTPQQKVELFRIVTGADYKDMVAFGAYSFYRVGIGPDGSWHFFVAGD
jgi:hypothetical protein